MSFCVARFRTLGCGCSVSRLCSINLFIDGRKFTIIHTAACVVAVRAQLSGSIDFKKLSEFQFCLKKKRCAQKASTASGIS